MATEQNRDLLQYQQKSNSDGRMSGRRIAIVANVHFANRSVNPSCSALGHRGPGDNNTSCSILPLAMGNLAIHTDLIATGTKQTKPKQLI
ncbi:MAG: hypothetical protein GY880_02225 [Planctomycetaceae bacterium]|nr:hypothetical protein [Planctomycetaceae bacterium]